MGCSASSTKIFDINKIYLNRLYANIKSKIILKRIFKNLKKFKSIELVKYNKKLQNLLFIDIKDYKLYSKELLYSPIEIDIIPFNNEFGNFININNKERKYYHIFFDNIKEKEIDRNYLEKNEKVSIIKIIIDYPVTSFKDLFKGCHCIKYIYFNKFLRKNIKNMSGMFSDCDSLKEINIRNFNTENVKDISKIFYYCVSLEKIHFSYFILTNAVNMSYMFYYCKSLKELKFSNFIINNDAYMEGIFSGCSDELKNKIKAQKKNIKERCFK